MQPTATPTRRPRLRVACLAAGALLVVSGCGQSVSGQPAGGAAQTQQQDGGRPTSDRTGGTDRTGGATAGKDNPLDPGDPAPLPTLQRPTVELPTLSVPGGGDDPRPTGGTDSDSTDSDSTEPDTAEPADTAEAGSTAADETGPDNTMSDTTESDNTESDESTAAETEAAATAQPLSTESATAAAGGGGNAGAGSRYDVGKGYQYPLPREWVKVKSVPFDGGTQHAFKYNAGGVTMSLITQTHPKVTTAQQICTGLLTWLSADLDNAEPDHNVPDPGAPDGYETQFCGLKYDDDNGDTYRRKLSVLHKTGSKDSFVMWVSVPLLGSDYETDRAAQQSASDAYRQMIDDL